ncbi:MAG TPA: hypothetical protein VF092_27045 [Longimicrobium sp.]
MRRRTGFRLLAACAAVIGAALAHELYHGEELVARVFLAISAALALVAADALWRDRPWAYRATVALAWTLAGVPIAAGTLGFSLAGMRSVGLVAIGVGSTYILAPAVRYVRRRTLVRHPAP